PGPGELDQQRTALVAADDLLRPGLEPAVDDAVVEVDATDALTEHPADALAHARGARGAERRPGPRIGARGVPTVQLPRHLRELPPAGLERPPNPAGRRPHLAGHRAALPPGPLAAGRRAVATGPALPDPD